MQTFPNIVYLLDDNHQFQGKGFPDMNTRLLLRKLRDQFSIPVLVLVDADPHGKKVLCSFYAPASKDLWHIVLPLSI